MIRDPISVMMSLFWPRLRKKNCIWQADFAKTCFKSAMWWINYTMRDVSDGTELRFIFWHFDQNCIWEWRDASAAVCWGSNCQRRHYSASLVCCVTVCSVAQWKHHVPLEPSQLAAAGSLNRRQPWTFISAGRLHNRKVKTRPDTFESKTLCSRLIPTHTRTHTSHIIIYRNICINI